MNTSRSKRRKTVVLRCRKISSTNRSVCTPASQYKCQIKTLKRNNKTLAVALQDLRCKLTDRENLLVESSGYLHKMRFAFLKMSDMHLALKSYLKDFDEVMLLLNVDISKWVDFDVPTRSRKDWMNEIAKFSRIEEVPEPHSVSTTEDLVNTIHKVAQNTLNENCGVTDVPVNISEEASENLTSSQDSNVNEVDVHVTPISSFKKAASIPEKQLTPDKASPSKDEFPETPKLDLPLTSVTSVETSSEVQSNFCNEKPTASQGIISVDDLCPQKVPVSKIPRIRTLSSKSKSSENSLEKKAAKGRKSIKKATEKLAPSLNRKTFVIKEKDVFDLEPGPSVLLNEIASVPETLKTVNRKTFVVKPLDIPEVVHNFPTDRRKTYVKESHNMNKMSASIQNRRDTVVLPRHAAILPELNEDCDDFSNNLSTSEPVEVLKDIATEEKKTEAAEFVKPVVVANLKGQYNSDTASSSNKVHENLQRSTSSVSKAKALRCFQFSDSWEEEEVSSNQAKINKKAAFEPLDNQPCASADIEVLCISSDLPNNENILENNNTATFSNKPHQKQRNLNSASKAETCNVFKFSDSREEEKISPSQVTVNEKAVFESLDNPLCAAADIEVFRFSPDLPNNENILENNIEEPDGMNIFASASCKNASHKSLLESSVSECESIPNLDECFIDIKLPEEDTPIRGHIVNPKNRVFVFDSGGKTTANKASVDCRKEKSSSTSKQSSNVVTKAITTLKHPDVENQQERKGNKRASLSVCPKKPSTLTNNSANNKEFTEDILATEEKIKKCGGKSKCSGVNVNSCSSVTVVSNSYQNKDDLESIARGNNSDKNLNQENCDRICSKEGDSTIPRKTDSIVLEKRKSTVQGKDVTTVPETADITVPRTGDSKVPEMTVRAMPEKGNGIRKKVKKVLGIDECTDTRTGDSTVPEMIDRTIPEKESGAKKKIRKVLGTDECAASGTGDSTVPEMTDRTTPEKESGARKKIRKVFGIDESIVPKRASTEKGKGSSCLKSNMNTLGIEISPDAKIKASKHRKVRKEKKNHTDADEENYMPKKSKKSNPRKGSTESACPNEKVKSKSEKALKKKSKHKKSEKNTLLVHAEVHPMPSYLNVPETDVLNLRNDEMQGLEKFQVSVVLEDIYQSKNSSIFNVCEKDLSQKTKAPPLKTVLSENSFNIHMQADDKRNDAETEADIIEVNSKRRRCTNVNYREPSLNRKMRR